MADNMKDKLQAAGDKISETATKVGHKVSETVEKATDWAKEKSTEAGHRLEETGQKVENAVKRNVGDGGSHASSIREHMDVVGSCGMRLGTVDHVQGGEIKLTKSGSPDGQHHLIPLSWVDHVDSHVHLTKDCGAAQAAWTTA